MLRHCRSVPPVPQRLRPGQRSPAQVGCLPCRRAVMGSQGSTQCGECPSGVPLPPKASSPSFAPTPAPTHAPLPGGGRRGGGRERWCGTRWRWLSAWLAFLPAKGQLLRGGWWLPLPSVSCLLPAPWVAPAKLHLPGLEGEGLQPLPGEVRARQATVDLGPAASCIRPLPPWGMLGDVTASLLRAPTRVYIKLIP